MKAWLRPTWQYPSWRVLALQFVVTTLVALACNLAWGVCPPNTTPNCCMTYTTNAAQNVNLNILDKALGPTCSATGGLTGFQDEGAARPGILVVNFTGAGVTCPDPSPGTTLTCSIPGGGSVSFDTVAGGTNTNALVVGTGGSLTASGSGIIQATNVVCSSCINLAVGTEVFGILGVANGGTGFASAVDQSVLIGTGAAYVQSTLTDCDNPTTAKVLYDTATRTFSCGTDQGTGSIAFLDLTDTPNSYTGHATKFIRVDAAGLATEFIRSDNAPNFLWDMGAGNVGCSGSTTGAAGVRDNGTLQYCDGSGILRVSAMGDGIGAALDVACTSCIDLPTESTGNIPYTRITNATVAGADSCGSGFQCLRVPN